MTTFLVKIGELHCPNGIGKPRSRADWDSSTFRVPAVRNSEDMLNAGDPVYVWVHEKVGGSGLTAHGLVQSVEASADGDKDSFLTLTEFEFFEPPRVDFSFLSSKGFDGTLGKIVRYSLRQTVALDIVDDANLRDCIIARLQNRWLVEARSDSEFNEADLGEVNAERELIARQIEARRNQGPFRRELMRRFSGRCAVTGTDVEEVLEAAHIVPFAKGHEKRDSPLNGILLRADVHTLFDQGLISINPKTLTVWVHDSLKGTEYEEFSGREISTPVWKSCLQRHFDTKR